MNICGLAALLVICAAVLVLVNVRGGGVSAPKGIRPQQEVEAPKTLGPLSVTQGSGVPPKRKRAVAKKPATKPNPRVR